MTTTHGSTAPPTSRRVAQRYSERAHRAAETERLLLEAARADDADHRRDLLAQVVVCNRGVADSVALRYRNRGVPVEDLQQAAYEGLVKAVQKFDPLLRNDLLTYAVPTMRGEIQRYFRDQSWMVRPPRRIQETQWRLNQTLDRLQQSLGREPERHEVRSALGISERELSEVEAGFGAFQPPSLDRPIGPEGAPLGNTLAERSDGGREAAEARAVLEPAMSRLSERDQRVVYLRFYKDQSQADIGRELGVTQMHVSRLLARIMRDLRGDIGSMEAPALVAH